MREDARRVLVVDDEPLVASYLCDLLGSCGFSCQSASSAADALWLVASHEPDAAIMDIYLNGATDGIALARLVRERFGTPIVFLSGGATDGVVADAMQIEHVRFLRKPSRASEIVQALELAMLKPGSNTAVGEALNPLCF